MEIQWIEGRFLARPNRFVAEVLVAGKADKAHVPNTGRLQELLVAGARVKLSVHEEPKRKYRLSLRQVYYKGIWVSIDSQLPNRLVRQALEAGQIFSDRDWDRIQPEAKNGDSRFDFALHSGEKTCWVEVKGVTLELDGWGYFPDAPTSRGTRHIRHLQSLVEAGEEGAVIFAIQNTCAGGITPNEKKDPAFAQAVREASRAGVQFLAFCWEFDGRLSRFVEERPVVIESKDKNREE